MMLKKFIGVSSTYLVKDTLSLSSELSLDSPFIEETRNAAKIASGSNLSRLDLYQIKSKKYAKKTGLVIEYGAYPSTVVKKSLGLKSARSQ